MKNIFAVALIVAGVESVRLENNNSWVDSNGVLHKTFFYDDESKYEERYKAIIRNEEKTKEK